MSSSCVVNDDIPRLRGDFTTSNLIFLLQGFLFMLSSVILHSTNFNNPAADGIRPQDDGGRETTFV